MIPHGRLGLMGAMMAAALATPAAHSGAYEIAADPYASDFRGRRSSNTDEHERAAWDNRQRHRKGSSLLDKAKRARGRL